MKNSILLLIGITCSPSYVHPSAPSTYLLFTHLSINHPIHLSTHASIMPSSHPLSIYLPIHPPSIHHSMPPSIHLLIHYLSIYHYVIISIQQPSVYSSTHLPSHYPICNPPIPIHLPIISFSFYPSTYSVIHLLSRDELSDFVMP